MKTFRIICAACAVALFFFATSAIATPLGTMSLEGQLLTIAGSPVPDGDYTLKVSFYKSKQDLKALHSETAQVKLVGGGFTVTLGVAQPLKSAIFGDGEAAWVGIQVGTDPELPRLPVNHVAYAWRAESAASLGCTGCLKAEHLDKSVLAPYALKADLKFAIADQSCGAGEHIAGLDAEGKVKCSKVPAYSGSDFALSKQSCAKGEVVAGLDAAGKVKCAIDGGATYSGTDFATSDQACPKGQLATAVGKDGKLVCASVKQASYSGKDFVLSNQLCGPGQVARGAGADGKLICGTVAADALSAKQVDAIKANKLADGSTPWTDPKGHTHAYDVDSTWLRDHKDDKHVQIHGNKRQLVMRTDGSAEYNKGVGAYPFVWMFGGDVAVNRLMAISAKGELWLNGYGWLHARFAAANKKCPGGQVMAGVKADGTPLCVVDKDTQTSFKATAGVKLDKNVFTLDTGFTDKRYVNVGQKNAINSAMIIDGQVTKGDLAANSVDGGKVVNGSLGGADLADGSVTGADLKDGSVGGADLADGSVTGADLKDGSVTSKDTDDNSVQRRVAGSCPSGQAIRAIGKDGKVTCVSDTGSAATKYSGKVKINRWYRIGQTGNGQQVAGTWHVYDATYGGSLTFRVGITKGDQANMQVTLLHHSRSATAVFTRIRVLESSSSKAHYLDIKANKDATVWYQLGSNGHANAWAPSKWIDQGTKDTVPGWGNRHYELDKLFMLGGADDWFSVMRNGIVRVQTGAGWIDIGAGNSSHAHIQTDRSNFYFNKRLRVDEGIISSHNEDLALQTSGKTRAWFDNKTGLMNTAQGISACKGNAGGCGIRVSDDGGFYDQNDSWIRAQISAGLLIRDQSNKAWRDLQARNITAHGNLHATGTVRADKGLQVDGKTVVDDGAGWHRSQGKTGWHNDTYSGGIYMQDKDWVRIYGNKHFLVGGDRVVRADGGFQVDGKTVIDNSGGWHYSHGAAGWRNATYGGGIYMKDSTWVRIYNNKGLYTGGKVQADGGLYVGANHVAKGNQACPTGQALTGFDKNGNKQCTALSVDVVQGYKNNAGKGGSWTAAGGWGQPMFSSSAAHTATSGNTKAGSEHLDFNIPKGMKTVYMSMLSWNNTGYFDVYLMMGGKWRFHRRVDQYQAINNTNEGGTHSGNIVVLLATGLDHFTKLRIQNRKGRIHFTGLGYSAKDMQGSYGSGFHHWDNITSKPALAAANHNHDTKYAPKPPAWGTSGKPAGSCLDLLRKRPELPTGDYYIRPVGATSTIKVYCDMTTEGGGYTFYPVASGITTRRWYENNTCKGLGMDIVYPRSKAHWDVMLKKYGSSYFATIPGVYKPASGGNYTNYIMRSPEHHNGGVPLNTWRVPDGGRWWMRDSKYSEPNGDYHANCWLSMYKHVSSDIRFNDGNCNYTTKKYICSTNDKR